MKNLKILLLVLFIAANGSIAQQEKRLKTQKDKVSYSIGLDIGKNLKTQLIEVEPEALIRGIKDALADAKPVMSEQEIKDVMAVFQKELMAKTADRAAKLGEKNKKEGDAYLAQNKKKEGVVALPSGLQYKIIKVGTGPKPGKESTVVCHYRGALLDGKEFDSSYKRGEPLTLQVNKIIPGWSEALQLMPVGSKWQLVIPPSLGYGERGAGADIGPHATLVFEVELISVK